MPSTINAPARRKVRCPKCTATLTEPETQIYECSICSTLLLAKGNFGNRLSENRVHKSSRDAEGIQHIAERVSRLEKARLIDELNSEQVQQRMDNVESENNVGFEGRSIAYQPELSYESTETAFKIPSEGHLPLDLDNQSLSKTRFSKQTTESVNDLVPKSTDLSSESPPNTPGRRRSPHREDISLKGESEHQFSVLDSASHTESEADLDSPTWSSENANVSEVPEVSSLVSSFEASSLVDRSCEHLSYTVHSPSSGSGDNDGAQRLQEKSEPEMRQQSNTGFWDRAAEEKLEHGERHGSLSPSEVADEEILRVEKDSRIRSVEVLAVASSGKPVLDGECTSKDHNYCEMSNDKEIDSFDNISSDGPNNGLTGSTGTKSPQSNVVDSRCKETGSDDSRLPQNDGDHMDVSRVGKFRLFDLSVFGIFNEETYSELRRGKAAHYSKLSESCSDGEGLQSTVVGEQVSHFHEISAQNSSREQGCAGVTMDENIAEVQKSSSVSELPVVETDGAYVKTCGYPEKHSNALQSGSVGQEVDDGGIIDLGDADLLPVTSTNSEVLANARYGDILAVKDLSLEAISSIDISFGDWRSQQVVKSPHKALEQNHAEAGSVDVTRVLNMATREGTDSSWDDDELTLSGTLKEDSKLKETAIMENEAQTSPGTRRSSGRSRAKNLSEKPTFPLRTTAMQKFLQREDQESIAETQSSQSFVKAESKLYEAPYMELYTPVPEKSVQEADVQTMALMSEQNVYDISYDKEHKPLIIAATKVLEETQKELIEPRKENLLGAHSSLALKVDNNDGVLPTPLSWNDKDTRTVEMHSREEFDSVRSPQRDATLDKMDETDMEMAALDSQKSDYWHANKVGPVSGKPVSLRWKGRGSSSTQSLSSTEDEGAYGMDFETAGSGPGRDSAKKQGVGLTEGHSFPDKEVKLGLGQHQPNARLSQRTWLGNIDVDLQKRSGEFLGSRRTARSRPANERLSNQDLSEQADSTHMEGRISNLEASGWSGVNRPEQMPAFQGQALNLNRSMLDQGASYSFTGTTDYNSDHSSRSQEVPPHPQYNKHYLSKPYGLTAAASARPYPFQVPTRGSVPPVPLQEQGFTHPAHHCLSPACSLCIQQQYYMQQPQMLQNVMLHPCAACASQSSAAAYQPIHAETHGHHMHALTYSNPLLRQRDSGVLPAQSQRQNMSSIHQYHPVPSTRRLKLYPPLPGKGAPPYVLCKACNQLLQVPGYLPPLGGPIQKLHCGACGKTSKFSISLQAAIPSANRVFRPAAVGLATNASEIHNFLAGDKRHMDIASVHSSEQIISSVGLSTPAQNLYGMARRISGQGFQNEGVENRFFLQPNASGSPSSKTESAGQRHHPRPRPMAGSVPGQAQYRSHGRHGEGDHLHTHTGRFSEDYTASSPSSASSPGRHSQMSRQIQQVEPLRMGRPGNSSADLPALSTMIEQGRSPFEAPSFSDGFFQKGANEGRSRFSSSSLQGSLLDPVSDSPHNEHLERLQGTSIAGSWHNQPADAEFSGRSSSRSRTEQLRKMSAAPGSPLIEHFTQDTQDVGPSTQHRHMLQNSGNGSRSAPWSPASGSPLSPLFDPDTQDGSIDFNERSHGRERPPLPVQDASKGPKSFAGLLKRSIKDFGKGGQGGNNRRKVVVNGHLIPEAAVRKAEEQAGTIYSGTYWYDYQAGFWGVMGGPCSGILMPFIEEFHFPLARDCAGGRTGILVNGRELHEKDLEVLAKRGLPKNPGKAYILDISGALFDDVTGQPLRGLGKLAPSIERKGRGCGMSQFAAQP